MKRLISLCMMLTCMATYASAQSGAITGKVWDEQKQPLAGAIVEAMQGNTRKGVAATDANGSYVIKGLNAGRYNVKISYTAYRTKLVKDVIVSPGKTTQINATLSPETKALGEIEIVSKAPQADRYTENKAISYEEIKRMPVRNTADIASTSAGIYQAPEKEYSRKAKVAPIYIAPQAAPQNESYKKDAENDFKMVSANPLSTMSVDVDRASYSNVRRFINEGQRPPVDAVRIEEMVNYFDYNYPQPQGEDPLAIVTEVTDCPWQAQHKLLHVGMQARKIATENLPASNMVFLIDVSGSMSSDNKLPLVISALKLLTVNLRKQDMISIVVYAGSAGLVLPATPGNNKRAIYDALDRLQAGGSTAGGAGIQLAYKVAVDNYVRGGNNRVILATDGDFNVGMSGDNDMEALITKERQKGIYLTCLGFGMGNYKDSKMEVLADKGNGNYAYIDDIMEAQKTLVNEFGGTLFTVAKDVKAQIEFNPAKVQGYRVVGYENRMLNEEDFKDDKKDAGDMGSGHTITIIYEIIPTGVNSNNTRTVTPLKYQTNYPSHRDLISNNSGEMATIKFRYKKPNGNTSKEMTHVIQDNSKSINNASENVRFATSVAMFGMLLKDSQYKGNTSYSKILNLAKGSIGDDENGYRTEYIALIKKAKPTINNDAEVAGWFAEED